MNTDIETNPTEKLSDYLPRREHHFPQNEGDYGREFPMQQWFVDELIILTAAGVPLEIHVRAMPMSDSEEAQAVEKLHEIDLQLHPE
jgi:hypothetical protein